LRHLLIYCFLFLSLFCSRENRTAKDSRVYARVGNNTLTDENLVLLSAEKPFSNDALQHSIESWIDQSLILSEAKKEGFEKDLALIKKGELYYNQLIISSFIEKHVSSRINILKDDVRLYYKQNKSSFIRNQDEAQIEQYIMESEKDARKLVRSFGSRKAIDTDRFSIRSTHQDIVKRGTFSKEVDDDIFIRKKSVVGPVFLGGNICVLKVLNRYKKGSFLGLDEVYDEVYQRLYKTKSITEKNRLLDSLKKNMNIYINPEYQ